MADALSEILRSEYILIEHEVVCEHMIDFLEAILKGLKSACELYTFLLDVFLVYTDPLADFRRYRKAFGFYDVVLIIDRFQFFVEYDPREVNHAWPSEGI